MEPRILILDEATSALDNESEHIVQVPLTLSAGTAVAQLSVVAVGDRAGLCAAIFGFDSFHSLAMCLQLSNHQPERRCAPCNFRFLSLCQNCTVLDFVHYLQGHPILVQYGTATPNLTHLHGSAPALPARLP